MTREKSAVRSHRCVAHIMSPPNELFARSVYARSPTLLVQKGGHKRLNFLKAQLMTRCDRNKAIKFLCHDPEETFPEAVNIDGGNLACRTAPKSPACMQHVCRKYCSEVKDVTHGVSRVNALGCHGEYAHSQCTCTSPPPDSSTVRDNITCEPEDIFRPAYTCDQKRPWRRWW